MNLITNFSDSNEYFQDTSILQSKVAFINPLNIDIYVRQSFSTTYNNITITGGDIQAFNKDHIINESCICYKIQLADTHAILSTQGTITIDLEKEGFFSITTLKKILQGIPLLSLLIISLLTYIAPPAIAIILRYISMLGIIITIFYYAWKIGKMLYKTITSKAIDYKGVDVYYENQADMTTINDTYIETLKQLQEMKIKKVVFYKGECYLKQVIKKTTFIDMIENIFKGEAATSTMVIQETIQKTIDFLFTTSFIGAYNKPAGQLTS